MRSAIIALGLSVAASFPSDAQENGPVVVPELLQKMAIELSVDQRLNIKWDAASPEEVGRYMGILAAVNEAAQVIAFKNDRETPADEDYLAALAAFCFWPPNKPPLVEPSWEVAASAFGNQFVRNAIQAGVGPLAISLPAEIANDRGPEAVFATWPQTKPEYSEKVLNLEGLK